MLFFSADAAPSIVSSAAANAAVFANAAPSIVSSAAADAVASADADFSVPHQLLLMLILLFLLSCC